MSVKKISVAANAAVGLSTATQWYGVRFVPGQSSTKLEQIAGDDSLLLTMPVHAKIQHACVNDDYTPNYWLDQMQLSKKADGTASDLTGTDGQVMGLIPGHYRRMWRSGGYEYYTVSEYALSGYTYVKPRWIGTFPATKDASDKLESVAGKYALTGVTPVNFLAYARNRGADWFNINYQGIFDMWILQIIEIADFNFQSAVSAGLSNAVSTDWNAYNGYSPLYENGSDAAELVSTGETALEIESFVGGTGTFETQVAVWRQFRLLTGVYEWLSGINIHNSVADGSRVFLCDVPASLAYDTETGHTLYGNVAEADGYIKEMLPFSILPKVVGGSSSTYYADYHYSYYDNDPASGWRAFRWFGIAYFGGVSGLACSNGNDSSGYSSASAGSRLCAFAEL